MADFDNLWSTDVVLTANGDVNTVTSTALGEQRVLRRLMTNPGDYIWHPDYGAGLPRYVGTNLNLLEIEGVIREQLAKEKAVTQSPPPVVKLRPILNGLFVNILWIDADTSQQATLEFDVTA